MIEFTVHGYKNVFDDSKLLTSVIASSIGAACLKVKDKYPDYTCAVYHKGICGCALSNR